MHVCVDRSWCCSQDCNGTFTTLSPNRGIIPLIMLRQLERLCGMETHKMFDYVCGTSTGAILAALLFVRRASIEEAEEMYREFSMQVREGAGKHEREEEGGGGEKDVKH